MLTDAICRNSPKLSKLSDKDGLYLLVREQGKYWRLVKTLTALEIMNHVQSLNHALHGLRPPKAQKYRQKPNL